MNKCLRIKLTLVLSATILLAGCSTGKPYLEDNKLEPEGKIATTSSAVNIETAKEITTKHQEKQVEQSKPKDTVKIITDAQKPSAISKKYAPDEIINYNKYTNPRYGFTIEYPSAFTVNEVADNGDGAEIVNGSVKIIVFGSNNIDNKSAKDVYEEEIKGELKEKITYKIQKDDWFIISWKDGNIINYKKTAVGKGSVNTFIISYPEDENAAFAGIVYHISNTFKTPGVEEVH